MDGIAYAAPRNVSANGLEPSSSSVVLSIEAYGSFTLTMFFSVAYGSFTLTMFFSVAYGSFTLTMFFSVANGSVTLTIIPSLRRFFSKNHRLKDLPPPTSLLIDQPLDIALVVWL